MKKAVSFLLTLALLAGLLSAWAAGPAGTLSVYFYDETAQRYGELTQTDRVSLTLDGSPLTPDDVPALVQYPVGQNGRTLVPVRLIAERLGASVTWVPETRQVILLREESTIVLTLGSATALVNGQAMELPGGVYNFGSGNDCDMFETVSRFAQFLGVEVPLEKDHWERNLAMSGEKLKDFGIQFDSTIQAFQQCLDDYGFGHF